MITIQKEINLSSQELAEEFWEKNSEEQAEFFNYLGLLIKNTYGSSSQLDNIMYRYSNDCTDLNIDKNGKWLIGELADRL